MNDAHRVGQAQSDRERDRDAAVSAKPRLPSLATAYLDLALYFTAALALGAWRSTRDT